MSIQIENSLSAKFLNEALAERGSHLVIKVVPFGRVLLIEDNPHDVFQVRRLFDEIKMELVAESDGEKAIERIKAEKFSLVLLDLNLLGMDGMDVLRTVRKASPAIHIVILTAQLPPDISEKARNIGYFGVCLKPLTRSSILDLLLQCRLMEIG